MEEIDNPLVDVSRLDASIRLDIRYATENNVWGRRFYPKARAYLRTVAANALISANQEFRTSGLGLVIYDAYRPFSVTTLLWDNTPPEKRRFVANPEVGSIHNRGCAVDAGLYDLKDGTLIPMPSGFDEMTDAAASDYSGGSEDVRRNRDVLCRVMERHSFRVHPLEWWHFDHDSWDTSQILNVQFDELP